MKTSMLLLVSTLLLSSCIMDYYKPVNKYTDWYRIGQGYDEVLGTTEFSISNRATALWYKEGEKYVWTRWSFSLYFKVKDKKITYIGMQNKLKGSEWVFPDKIVVSVDGDVYSLKYDSTKRNTRIKQSGELELSEYSRVDLGVSTLELFHKVSSSSVAFFRFTGTETADFKISGVCKGAIKAFLHSVVREGGSNESVEYLKSVGYDGRVMKFPDNTGTK